MTITGYRLMDRLEELKERTGALDAAFGSAMFKFADEQKADPHEIARDYERIETVIGQIQEAQARYNLLVLVPYGETTITLEYAIKLQGVMGRLKNQWKNAAQKKPNRYGLVDDFTRDANAVVAARQVSEIEALEQSAVYAKRAQKLKQAIRSGNAQERDVPLDPSVFDD